MQQWIMTYLIWLYKTKENNCIVFTRSEVIKILYIAYAGDTAFTNNTLGALKLQWESHEYSRLWRRTRKRVSSLFWCSLCHWSLSPKETSWCHWYQLKGINFVYLLKCNNGSYVWCHCNMPYSFNPMPPNFCLSTILLDGGGCGAYDPMST